MSVLGINPNPTTPRKQLRAFYARQGLTGKQLRSAMKHDLRQVRRYAIDNARNVYPGLSDAQIFRRCNLVGMGIRSMFLLCETKEGVSYWRERSAHE